MARKKLSDRQRSMLQFIADYTVDFGRPPTIREIGTDCDITSTSVVNYNLKKLEKDGFLERGEKMSRGIRLLDKAFEVDGVVSADRRPSVDLLQVPIAGNIFADTAPPMYADPSSSYAPDEFIELTRGLVTEKESDQLYALRVQGDSMIDAMVSEGDIVVLKKVEGRPKNGDMVAAWLLDDDAPTLKHFYLEGEMGETVRLKPANPNLQDLVVPANKIRVDGKVVLVVRQM